MPEVVNEGFITKIKKGQSEYEHLYLQGVEWLQKLSSAKWTDYNEHDPGVTILENLVYALTSLSYKTNLAIRDILTESKGGKLESGDNGFFIASDILTTNPITIFDLRKIFIDQITNVKNVWLKPFDHDLLQDPAMRPQNRLNGLYKLYISLYEYNDDKEAQKQEEERIISEAKTLFHAHRNLCEDLFDIIIFKPFKLQARLKLTLKDGAHGEKVFANIYNNINNYLNPEVKFHSLWELLESNVAVNSIFDGPKLENGFIPDEDLNDSLNKIVMSDIIKRIAKVSDVISVDYFQLLYQDDQKDGELTAIETDSFTIPANHSPVFLLPDSNAALVFENNGVRFSPNLLEIKRLLSYVKTMNYGSFKSVSKSFNTIEIPEGASCDIKSYYPIREQFPLIYGIGHFGLQKGLSDRRYAQANQLKAYLLPFDQLMANFLGQLTQLYKIYDVKSENLQSYFYQELEDMPNLLPLIRSDEFESREDTLNNWKITLQQINARYDQSAVHRLNEVANNLLARFGEQFPTYTLRKLNETSYGKKLTDTLFDKHQLSWKRRLIRDYDQLSYNRVKAYDYTQPVKITDSFEVDDLENRSVPKLIQKIAILVGIKNFSLRSLSKMMLDSGITIYQKKEELSIIRETIEVIRLKEGIEIIEKEEIVFIDETPENLWNFFYFTGSSDNILDDILRNGIIRNNYQVKPAPKEKGKAYYVSFTKEGQQHVIHISNSEEEAVRAIDYSINFLVDINEKSEGIYFVEHFLLSPPYHGNYYGFSFSLSLNKQESLTFEQIELKPNDERNSDVSEIMTSDKLQFQTVSIQERYAIQMMSAGGAPLAITVNRYENQQAAQAIVGKIVTQIPVSSLNQRMSQPECYAYYGANKVPEAFFSFQMSFILPSWPVRFQNNNFRTRFDNVVSEEAPVYIAFQSYWLDLREIQSFEKIYYRWLQSFPDKQAENRMNYAYQLINKIQNYRKLKTGD